MTRTDAALGLTGLVIGAAVVAAIGYPLSLRLARRQWFPDEPEPDSPAAWVESQRSPGRPTHGGAA